MVKVKKKKISQRIEELQSQIEKAKTPFEIEQLQNRLAKMVGGVSIIHVGGYTETEMREKKDRVDDALNATKAALEEGIVPGGGVALLYAREAITNKTEDILGSDLHIGKQIVYLACGKPFETILTNAGYDPAESQMAGLKLEGAGSIWDGFNIKTEDIVNMKEAGIIDPTKVTRTALENAAAVAGTVLLTECVVVPTGEEKNTQEEPLQF